MKMANVEKEYQKPTWEKQQLFERYALLCACTQSGGCTAGKTKAPKNNAS